MSATPAAPIVPAKVVRSKNKKVASVSKVKTESPADIFLAFVKTVENQDRKNPSVLSMNAQVTYPTSKYDSYTFQVTPADLRIALKGRLTPEAIEYAITSGIRVPWKYTPDKSALLITFRVAEEVKGDQIWVKDESIQVQFVIKVYKDYPEVGNHGLSFRCVKVIPSTPEEEVNEEPLMEETAFAVSPVPDFFQDDF